MNAKFDKESLIRTLEDFGVPDPEYWAEEELRNGFPWLAAFRFLRPLQKHLDGYLDNPEEWTAQAIKYNDELSDIIRSMLDAGVASKDIGLFAYWISRIAYNYVLHRLTDPAGGDYDLEKREWNCRAGQKVSLLNIYTVTGIVDSLPLPPALWCLSHGVSRQFPVRKNNSITFFLL